MATERDLVVLGVGMHPWGKWGRNFVEYGLVAAKAALADADMAWRDIQFVAGADTIRNGYPGYIAGATFSQALGWKGNRVASCYAACAFTPTLPNMFPWPSFSCCSLSSRRRQPLSSMASAHFSWQVASSMQSASAANPNSFGSASPA